MITSHENREYMYMYDMVLGLIFTTYSDFSGLKLIK